MTGGPDDRPTPDLTAVATEAPEESVDRESDAVGDVPDVGDTVPPSKDQ